MIAILKSCFFLLTSPIMGSTKVNPRIIGMPNAPALRPSSPGFGEISRAIETASAPHARAEICSDSYSLCPTITIPDRNLMPSSSINEMHTALTN